MSERSTRKWITFGMVALLVMLFALTTESFFSWKNISNLLRGASYVGIIASGLTVVIIAGGNDLSTGAVVGLVCMLATRLLYADVPVGLVIALCCLSGVVCGLVNGLIITKLRLPDFIATLATLYVFSGLTLLVSFRVNGQLTTRAVTNLSFLQLGQDIGGIFYVTIAWFVVAALIQLLLTTTKFGVYVYAIGANPSASLLSGINFTKIKITTYCISGACSALAAVFLLGYQGAAAPTTGGIYTFNAICAAVIGGAALTGGHGDAIGTLLGCAFIQLLSNGIYKMNLPSEYQTISIGVVIIAMSVFNTLYLRRQNRRLRRLALADEKGGA